MTITVNGREYTFKERIVIGAMMEIDSTRIEMQKILTKLAEDTSKPENGWRDALKLKYSTWKAIRAVEKNWRTTVTTIFQNASGLESYKELTSQEVEKIYKSFFDFVEAQKTLSEISPASEEKKVQ